MNQLYFFNVKAHILIYIWKTGEKNSPKRGIKVIIYLNFRTD